MASPAQAQALLGAVARIRPDLTAFFGCLYYAALRPEEAIALRAADCYFPDCGWGMLTVTAACPRTAAAWTGDGSSHEQRGLKHRPDGAVRMVPIPPVLAAMLRAHYRCHGTAPDGRLFRGTRGGPLSESVYGRAWHAARALALGPELAATGLARRPYDLRQAALSLWLSAGAPPAEVAARAGHSVTVLLSVYAHCIDGHDRITNQLIEDALRPGTQHRARKQAVPRTAGTRPDAVRYMSVLTGIQAAHRTDSHGHCPQNRLTCANQQAEPCTPMRHGGSTCSSPTGRRPAPGRRGSAWTTAGCATGARRWKACPPRRCRDSPRRKLTFAARLRAGKAPDVLIEALALIDAPPSAHLVGDGPAARRADPADPGPRAGSCRASAGMVP